MPEQTLTVEEKLKEYEKLLQQILKEKVKREGKVLAGPDNGYFKVKVGNDEFLVKDPPANLKVKVGDHVVMIDGVIIEAVPESLITVEEEVVEFKRIGWEEIGGMKSQIESIRKKVEYPVKYASIYKEFKLPTPKGILLYGPTGCGKTLIAKAIASSMLKTTSITNSMFVYLKGGELLSKYVGVAENRIKSAFDAARKTYKKTGVRPILFIDEAEAILPTRGSRVSSDVDTTIVPTFLSEMDGFQEGSPFVLLATNYEDKIDTAILRPGRIDLKIYVGLPTQEDSVEIFKIHLSKTRVSGNIDHLSKVAAKHLFSTEKLQGEISGALIENIVYSAVEIAISRKIHAKQTNDAKQSVTGVTEKDILAAIVAR